jgi:hypothetical protein
VKVYPATLGFFSGRSAPKTGPISGGLQLVILIETMIFGHHCEVGGFGNILNELIRINYLQLLLCRA